MNAEEKKAKLSIFLELALKTRAIVKAKAEDELKASICRQELELALSRDNEEEIKAARDHSIAVYTVALDNMIRWYRDVIAFETNSISTIDDLKKKSTEADTLQAAVDASASELKG